MSEKSYQKFEDTEKDNVKEWIKKQNDETFSALKNFSGREQITKTFKGLISIKEIDVPYYKNGYYFTMEKSLGDDLRTLYIRKSLNDKKKVLIKEENLSSDKSSVLKRQSVSSNGKFLAYAVSKKNSDKNEICVMNIKTGEMLKDKISSELYPVAHSGISWRPDNDGFLYSKVWHKAPKKEGKLYQKVYYHKLGTDSKNDKLVFGENINKEDLPSASFSSDGDYILVSVSISAGKTKRNELYLKDLRNPNNIFVPIIKDVDATFNAHIHQNKIFAITDYKAPNRKIISIQLKKVKDGVNKWETVIPESSYSIRKAEIVSDRIFVETVENVHSVLKKYDLKGEFISKINLPNIGSVEKMVSGKDDELFFRFSSFSIPPRIYRLNIKTDKKKIFSKTKIDADFKNIEIEQVWFKSKDGTKIPMFLIHKKKIERNGKNPTLIYGYGGFGQSQLPKFSATKSLFFKKGGIVAVPNIRGGGEFGEKWHKAGIQDKKQNTFNDFISATEWLIDQKYTEPNHIATIGYSNGGLVVTTVMTQRPELFKAVVAVRPLTDMLRFHKFPGGAYWTSEYGNPEKPKDHKYLLKYSPYHNIDNKEEYPAVLVVTSKEDDRVHPMHSYKLVARLKESNSKNIYLRVEEGAGHSGHASVSKLINELTDIYSFIFWQLGK